MTSLSNNIPVILDIILFLKPKRVVDIGSGFGKFGLMTREVLLASRAESDKDLLPKDNIIIDSVEESEYFYSKKIHESIYNNTYKEDALNISNEFYEKYDLILLIDVVEHWNKEVAIKFINSINTNILISTPKKVHFFKDKYYGSREHISQFTKEDFKSMGIVDDHSTDKSFIYFKRKK